MDLGVLDDSLVISEGANGMKITYNEGQGIFKRPRKGKTGLESPLIKDMHPISFRDVPNLL